MEFLTKKSKSMLAVRKIRSFDDDFDPKMFPQECQDIYMKAHEALAKYGHILTPKIHQFLQMYYLRLSLFS